MPGGCPRGTDLVGLCIDPATGRTTYTYSSNFLFYATNDAEAACAGTFVPMGARTSVSCELRPGFPLCIDGSGTVSDIEQASGNCELFYGGVLGSTPCPTAGRSGTCSYEQAGVDIRERWYDNTTAFQAGCTAPEVWTPN